MRWLWSLLQRFWEWVALSFSTLLLRSSNSARAKASIERKVASVDAAIVAAEKQRRDLEPVLRQHRAQAIERERWALMYVRRGDDEEARKALSECKELQQRVEHLEREGAALTALIATLHRQREAYRALARKKRS